VGDAERALRIERPIPDDRQARLVRLRVLVIELWTRAIGTPTYEDLEWAYFVALSPLGDVDGVLGMPGEVDVETRIIVRAMTRSHRKELLWRMLHVLWTHAGCCSGYDKSDWREIDGLVGFGDPDPEALERLLALLAASEQEPS
jgi:hypothetical protein